VAGAAAGRERVVTPMTTMKTAVKIEAKPAQVRRPMRSKVRTEAQRATMMVARKDHYAPEVSLECWP